MAAKTEKPRSRVLLVSDLLRHEELNAKLNAQYEELDRMFKDQNGRLKVADERTKALRASVDRLKDTARFYRAQRDRVDAYLSAVLDCLRPAPPKGPTDEQVRAAQSHAHEIMRARDEAMTSNNRPRINEPMVRNQLDNGGMAIERAYAGYRDREPDADWEDL